MKGIRGFVSRTAVALVTTGMLFGAAACSDVAGPTGPAEAPAAARAVPLTLQDSLNANLITPQQFQLALLSLLEAVKPCLKDGYKNYTTTKGVAFKNVLECALYTAIGGKLVPIAPPAPAAPVIVSFTFAATDVGCNDTPLAGQFTATFTGGTGTITTPSGDIMSVSSGVPAPIPGSAPGNYTLTVTGSGGSISQIQQPFGDGTGGIIGCSGGGPILNIAPVGKGRIVP